MSPFLHLDPTLTIEKDLLKYDGAFVEKSPGEIRNYLVNTDLDQFIYELAPDDWGTSYYDPNREVLRTLNFLCRKKDLTFL